MPHSKSADPLADYHPVGLAPRRDGWTADRQRLFLQTLAETGCISTACDEVNMTPRSAYRLRAHPNGALFARAWDAALLIATGRLMTLAFERAINGIPKSIWRDDKLVAETRQPSERLMMFLLTHLMPDRFGGQPMMNRRSDHRVASATAQLPGALDRLADVAPDLCPSENLCASDYEPQPPDNEVA